MVVDREEDGDILGGGDDVKKERREEEREKERERERERERWCTVSPIFLCNLLLFFMLDFQN